MGYVREQLVKGTKFLAILGAVSLLVYLAVSWGPILSSLESLTAWGSSLVLNLLGIKSWSDGSLVHFQGNQALIIPLCTGGLEIAILVGAILASDDRPIRSRVMGLVLTIPLVLAINFLRIGLTLASAVWFGWSFADLVHTLLFKIFLILVIVGIYALWYLGLATKTI